MDLTTIFQNTQKASRALAILSADRINAILIDLARAAVANAPMLIAENEKDLARMDSSDPKFDRLKLSESRISDIAKDIENVARLDSPLGRLLLEKELANGLNLKKVSVPLGVVGVIYEARPNVTFDVFALCLKTGNASVLKGGSDASYSNEAIIALIHDVLKKHGVDVNSATLLPSDRKATEALLTAIEYVDVIIPRGSQQLINFVRQNAKVPVIETGAGIVHTYVDANASLEKGRAIINNSKTRRVSVCNSLDCLLVNQNQLVNLRQLVAPLVESNVQLFADARSHAVLKGSYPQELLSEAREEHFGTEFLDYKMAIKTVDSLDEALDHIAGHSSKHSEAIISEDEQNIERFLNSVDAAAVYANSSTAFTDGAQFGLGAEIGISTQKLHARGPMGLEELTSYKWIVRGNGQVRPA
ncbi:glutamate-5-semialdehyde dehydrogenase [Desertivirga xinjiangensis]|uniref:glutamate-5-semialdehyde dehydrogenase n=1 Tax=Desertivirga xinjiangensis TaxID=539206 RepID=UPI002108D6C7|nr:glutamate-5-semialdehyde dehydrogenase [Pedobacter xinjiangensis]